MGVFLVATDGSQGGKAAVREAARLAAAHHAKLIVMTVIPRDVAMRTGASKIGEYARAEHLSGELEACNLIAEDVLAEAKAVVSEHGNLIASYISLAGDPATEIVTSACERAVDLLILGSRGQGLLGAFLFGSVSRRVADAAPCALKIVPATN